MLSDEVSSDSKDSDDEQGGRDDIPIPVHAMQVPVPTKVLHAMLV